MVGTCKDDGNEQITKGFRKKVIYLEDGKTKCGSDVWRRLPKQRVEGCGGQTEVKQPVSDKSQNQEHQ